MARQNDNIGFFVLNDAATLPRPRTDQTIVLQCTTVSGRTAGHLYLYKSGTWAEYAPVTLAALTAIDSTAIDATYGSTEEGVLNNVRTRLNEIEARLSTLGLLP